MPSATAVHQAIINPHTKDEHHEHFNRPHPRPNHVRAFVPSRLAMVRSVDTGRSPNAIFHCPTRRWFDEQADEIAAQVSSYGYAVIQAWDVETATLKEPIGAALTQHAVRSIRDRRREAADTGERHGFDLSVRSLG